MTETELLDRLWRFWPHTFAEKLSDGRWVPYRHLTYLGDILAEAIGRGNARIVISMPPRHGKSELCSKWLPAWFLENNPDKRVIITSYEASYAAEWGQKTRDLIAGTPGFTVKIKEDSKAKNRWHTREGGGMQTAGMGGSLTGKGADLLIIDDPVKNWKDAQSATKRKNDIYWFDSTAHSRVEPGGSIIIIQTRWHERDLAGWAMSDEYSKTDGPWIEVKLPAIAEEEDAIGRNPGEALCPERYSIETLNCIRGSGGMVWNAIYQQSPSGQTGNIIRRDWMNNRWHKAPEFTQTVQSWDCTFKDTEGSDFVVGQVWGKKGADKYLLDQVRGRMDLPATIEAVKALSAKWPRAKRKLIEDKANGPAVISSLKRKISGLIPVEPRGDKVARASSVAPEWESGNIWLPEPETHPWVNDFVEELVSFPNAAHDDQVDAMSQALDDLCSNDSDWLKNINKR